MPTPRRRLPTLDTPIRWDRTKLAHYPANSRLGSPAQPGRALFLDRDGVLIEDMDYLRTAGQIRILPGVPEFLRAAQSEYCLIVITNQSGIARGFFSEDDLYVIHCDLASRFEAQGVQLDALYYCPHLPDAPAERYRQTCECRKPAPGMLLRAAEEWKLDLKGSVTVGDRPRDIQAGEAAGTAGVLLGEPASDEVIAQVPGLQHFLNTINPLDRSLR